MTEVTNDELCNLVLAWAKEAHPDYYEKTLKVATNNLAFRKYLLRLVEIRATEDRAWRNSVCPIRVLDETSLVLTIKQKASGAVRQFKGQSAKPPIDNRIMELGTDALAFQQLQAYKAELDLTYVLPIA